MLQIVFREGPIDRAAENFMQFFLQGQQLEQRERLNEIRKEELKLRQEAFEQELNELNTAAALNRSQLAANPALMQDPAVASVLGQIANANAPAGTAQALGPAINQAVVTQATQAARAQPGQTEQAQPEAPPVGQFETASQALGVSAPTRTAVRREISPTQPEAFEDRLQAIKMIPALRLGERMLQGEVSPERLAATADLETLVAVTQLGAEQDILDIRRTLRDRMRSREDFSESLLRQAREQAASLLDELNLEGEIPLGLAVRFIQEGREGLTEDQLTRVAPAIQGLEQARLKQQIGLAAATEETPVQTVLTLLSNTALEQGDQETAIKFYNKKREIARRQTGLSGGELPFPELGEEFSTADEIINALVPFGDPRSGDITVNLPTIDGEFTQDELQEVSSFIVEEHGGDVQAAFRAMQRQVRDAGGIDQIPEDARRTFEAVRFLRDSLRSNGERE